MWAVYFDCEIKHTSPKAVRALFDRCIAMDTLPLNKMKFFFKRYMDYETKHGTPKKVEKVKQLAIDFVNTLPKTEEDEEERKEEEIEEEESEEDESEEDE